ncbi:LysR family transcriptional regulator [Mesorhizobium silamurunense]|uniref:LysR family transcriptional regulator n=1 Tax=Mesorhizobium silamurunense TaxID=499528 RepID=UPI001785E31F|nr:LysR family transcriptional regulator [Mesorhizobium silamurunense]
MEMQQVRYFLALSNTLNFTRAAEECNVTQPALTRAIKTLEEELGGELLRRERQHSHLTELGRRMLPLLQQCYDAATSAKSLAKAVQSSDVAPLNVTISNSVNIALLVSTFTELFRAYPGVHLKINRGSPTAVVDALKNGEVELAVAGAREILQRCVAKAFPVRGLLGVHSRPAHWRGYQFVPASEGFSHLITSMTAPIASGWSGRQVGPCTHWKLPLVTAHIRCGRFGASTPARRVSTKEIQSIRIALVF